MISIWPVVNATVIDSKMEKRKGREGKGTHDSIICGFSPVNVLMQKVK